MKKMCKASVGVLLVVMAMLWPVTAAARPLRAWNQKASYYHLQYNVVQKLYDEVLPVSNQRMLTQEDLLNLSPDELRLARNEIYARKGYAFQNRTYEEFFGAQSWYASVPGFTEGRLTQLEKRNAEFLLQTEQQEAARLQLVGAGLVGVRTFQKGDSIQINTDINGDGVKEAVRMRLTHAQDTAEDTTMEVTLLVGNQQMRIMGRRFTGESLYLMDFVQDDGALTIGIVDYGLYDDEERIMLFRYDGSNLTKLKGELHANPQRLRLDGSGTARTHGLNEQLATTTQLVEYRLEGDAIVKVESDIALINLFAVTKQELPLITSLEADAKPFTVASKQRVLLRRIMPDGWVEVLTTTGRNGYMQVQLPNYQLDQYEAKLNGKPLFDYLDGLIYVG